MSETNNKGVKCWHLPAFYCNNYLGQRTSLCVKKIRWTRSHLHIPLGVPVYDRGAWDGGSFLETDPGNVDAGVLNAAHWRDCFYLLLFSD